MTDTYAAADGLVRVYPGAEPDGTGLVWAHGGGFAFGDLDMPEADHVARTLAARGTTVVSVDYRLAPVPADGMLGRPDEERPGHHYPAASDDIVAAWEWTLAHAADLGIDRLAIGGASAGANLATGATLRLMHDGGALPTLVVLAYPTLHAVQGEMPAELRAKLDADPEADRFRADTVRAMYENYLGNDVHDADIYAVPGTATAAELTGFPPVLMINGDADELRVSGEAFAATLVEAGVAVDVSFEPGTQHGHLNRPHEPAASTSLDRIAARLAALPASQNA